MLNIPTNINANAIIHSGELEVDNSANNLAFRTYSYRENLFAEFEKLVQEGKKFDGLIIDLTQTGFSLPLEGLIQFHFYAKKLLNPKGVLLFIKPEVAVTLTKDDQGSDLNFNVYDSPFGIFTRYPMLTDYVCATVSGIDRRKIRGGKSTLAKHILFTSIPVLTEQGSALKNYSNSKALDNRLIQYIDDYITVESIIRLVEKESNIPADETLRLLQELETAKLIYPIFSRVQFLVNCYHNHKPFRLGRYMVEAGIISPTQLEDLLELQQEEVWSKGKKPFLGLLATKKSFITTRELEILLYDQYLYGGYYTVAEENVNSTANKKHSLETMRNSVIGSLGAMDSAGLLQSIATAKKTGILVVEEAQNSLVVAFWDGRPTHARLGKLKGLIAITEYLVNWTEGVFVFRDQGDCTELDESCALTQSLDRILIDAAFYQDQIAAILSKLPARRNTIFERASDFNESWANLNWDSIKYYDGSSILKTDQDFMFKIACAMNGLTSLEEIMRTYDEMPSYIILEMVQFLLNNHLIVIQQTSLFKPLTVFQRIVSEMQDILGFENNKAILEASLRYAHNDAAVVNRFQIDRDGRVSINLSQVNATGTPVSSVLVELRKWMEAYLAYARQQIDPSAVDAAIAKVVQASS